MNGRLGDSIAEWSIQDWSRTSGTQSTGRQIAKCDHRIPPNHPSPTVTKLAIANRPCTIQGSTYIVDGRGRRVRKAIGAIVQRLDVQPFGEIIQDSAPGWQPFGFAGGLYDPDTGLVRFGARDYDPVAGRWAAKDPSLFEGSDSDLYAYGFSDPVNHVDPDGKIANFVTGVAIGHESIHRTNALEAPISGRSDMLWRLGTHDDIYAEAGEARS
jgi:RHS repeat-associated protein